jgi:hypothetical protein
MKRRFRFVNRRLAGALAVTALLMVPLGVFGGSAVARTVSAVGQYGHGHSGGAQYQYRVTICHHTGSRKHPWIQITVSSRAVPFLLRHGDQLPPCPTTGPVRHRHHHHHLFDDGSLFSGSLFSHHGDHGHHGHDDDD